MLPPMLRDNLSILHVEDNEIDRINVKRAFSRHDIQYPLFQVNNGQEAVEFLKDFQPHASAPTKLVLLLDINMPVMSGLELLETIRANDDWKHLPVFIMTTSDNESDKEAAYGLNVSGYIVKPLSLDKFNLAITTLTKYWQLIRQ